MLKKYILKFINIIIKLLNNFINYLNKKSKTPVKIIHKEYNQNGNFMSFVIVNNNKIDCSIISGIPRNTIPFNDIIKLSKGQTLLKSLNNRFFKSFKSLNINIKSVTVTIKQTNKKLLDKQIIIITH